MSRCTTKNREENHHHRHSELVDENSVVSKNESIANITGTRRPNDESKHLKCDLCEKKFRETNMLAKHIKLVHEKVKNYRCERCEKEFM